MNPNTSAMTNAAHRILLNIEGGDVYVVHADSEHQVHRVLRALPKDRATRATRIARFLTKQEARRYPAHQHIDLHTQQGRESLLVAVS